MNEIPQNWGLRSPSLTLYAFHLRNSIKTVPEASWLWEELVDLGNALQIRELQNIRQELLCYDGDRYFPEEANLCGYEHFTLLKNQKPSLRFQVPPQPGGLKLQGVLCPFRLHDTYAIDLTLYSQETLTLPELSSLNPQNLLLEEIQADLGQTLLLFGSPLETREENDKALADALVAQLVPEKYSIDFVGTGRLLSNPIFEYESRLTNRTDKLHIIVGLKYHNMNQIYKNSADEILLYLLWFRHKILYVDRKSRGCVKFAQELDGNVEQYKQDFHQIANTPNRLLHLKNLQKKLQLIELNYTDYIKDLEDHQNTLEINEENYQTKLTNLEKLPDSQFNFCQDFLQLIRKRFKRQIQADQKYLATGCARLQRLKATVLDSIALEPVESEPGLGRNPYETERQSAPGLYFQNDSVKGGMTGIPPEIYSRLSEALLDCDQFDDAQRLRNFFKAHAPLRPWRHRWKASSPPELVEDAIGFLNDKFRDDTDDTKENALVILVGLLAQQIDPADSRHRTLTELAQELHTVLSSGSSAIPLGQRATPNSKPKLSIVPNQTDNTLPESLPAVRFGQEANPQGESIFFLAADEKLLTCARSVARVSVPRIIDGRMEQVPTGTGWLVTPELALTCWHVIEARGRWDAPISEVDLQEQIANSLLIFKNVLPGQGVEYKIEKLEYYNADLDYALLRLQDRTARPLQQWGFLRLEEDEPVTVQTQIRVIQHPKGQPQQRSGGYFVKLASDANSILHNAPTERGTSGAPVLKANNWQVVALHNGENETEQLREATSISAILSDLRQNRKELYGEILEAQHS